MNTKKIILPALLVTGLVLTGTFTFASASDTTASVKNTVKHARNFTGERPSFMSGDNQPPMSGDFQPMSGDNRQGNGFEKFIDNDSLTDDQTATLNSLRESHQTNLKSIMDQFTGTLTDTQKTTMISQIKEVDKSFFDSLETYVSEDKLTEYETFVTNYLANIGTEKLEKNDKSNRKNKTEIKNNSLSSSTGTYKYLVGNTYNGIKTKLENMSTDKLNLLLTKIDAAITQYSSSDNSKKQLYLDVYGELKTMIDSIINGDSDADDLLESILG